MDTEKKCPMCAEEIKIEATTCEYCGAQFEVTRTGYCEHCHAMRDADENGQCKICGNKVVDLRVLSRYIEEQPSPPAPVIKKPEPSIPRSKSSWWKYLIPVIVFLAVGIGVYLLLHSMGSIGLIPFALKSTPTQQPTDIPGAMPGTTLENLPTPTPRATRTPQVVASPTPTLAFDVPLPQAGTGNVVGRILWNRLPVAKNEVKLCEDFGMIGGCKGAIFSVFTDDNGYYLFQNIPPREYALTTRAIDKANTWLYMTASLGIGAKKLVITADETLHVADQSIYKFDLKQSSPADDSEISEAQPTLTWNVYTDAAYYKVYLRPDKGKGIFSSERVDTNQITPPKPLLGCKYTWQVDAYNADGKKIAEHDGYFHFTLIDQPNTCHVLLISPKNKVSLVSTGLTLSWEAHSLASDYHVVIWDKDYKDQLDRATTTETTFVVPTTLGPGSYRWYITAYDQEDDDIAVSDFYEFTITGP